MRSRFTIAAALAVAAATIMAVAACGSSITGAAQANTAAAESMTSTSSTTSSARTSSTSDGGATATALPTDLSELNSLLSELPTDLSVPTDLSLPTDFTLPTELTNLNVPGYNSACLSVGLAYAGILFATYPAALGGSQAFDSTELQKTISDLAGQVPPEIAGDIATLGQIAVEANGKSLTEVSKLFESDEFTTATKHIEDWTTANCGG